MPVQHTAECLGGVSLHNRIPGELIHARGGGPGSDVRSGRQGRTEVDLDLPCTTDFNVLAGKYFNLLDPDTAVPLSLLFSGSVFYRDTTGLLQVTRIPWSAEAAFSLEVRIWRDVLGIYYPNTAWVGLRQEVFDALYAYRVREGCLDFDDALGRLLEAERVR